MKILIAEDDHISRRLLHLILRPYGEVDIAVDGQEAIDFFEMSWDEGRPYSLLMLDLMMPGIGGIEVLKYVRNREVKWIEHETRPLGPLKVIMTTALAEPRNVFSAYHEGADLYLLKPIKQKKLELVLAGFGLSQREPVEI